MCIRDRLLNYRRGNMIYSFTNHLQSLNIPTQYTCSITINRNVINLFLCEEKKIELTVLLSYLASKLAMLIAYAIHNTL